MGSALRARRRALRRFRLHRAHPGAGVEPGDALTEEILSWATDKLAKYKTPRSIDYVDEMPRDPNGKLYKRKLRDPYWEGRDRAI